MIERVRRGRGRRGLRPALGRHPGAQPLARRLLQGGARTPRRDLPDLPALRRGVGEGDPLGEGERAHRRRAAARRAARARASSRSTRPRTSRSSPPAPSSACRSIITRAAPRPDFGPYLPQSLAMFMLEVTWWAHRSLWHLMFSGVFERHPKLQFVLTETGVDWAPDVLAKLDHFLRPMRDNDQCSEHIFGRPTVEKMSLMPSEYFARQMPSRRELPAAGRVRAARHRSASTRSCGARTTPTSRAPTPTRASSCASPSPACPSARSSRWWGLNAANALRLRPRGPGADRRTHRADEGGDRDAPRPRATCRAAPSSVPGFAPDSQLASV